MALVALGAAGLALVVVAAQGARRSGSAYDRLRAGSEAHDAVFGVQDITEAEFQQLAQLDGVEAIGRFSYVPVAPSPLVPGQDAGGIAALDPVFLDSVYRPVVLAGRLPGADAEDEVVINEALAEAGDLTAGDEVRLQAGFEDPQDIGPATVVGVVRGTFDVGPNAGNPSVLLTDAFRSAHADALQVDPSGVSAVVRLEGGPAAAADFGQEAQELLGRPFAVGSADDEGRDVQRILELQELGLALVALVALAATVLAVGQGLARLLGQAFTDLPTLVAIGYRPRDRLRFAAVLALPVALGAPLVAAAISWWASGLVPTGFARTVDPIRGLQFDGLAVLVAAVVWIVLMLVSAVGFGWREGRRAGSGAVRRGWIPRLGGLRTRLALDAALRRPGRPGGAAASSALVASVVGIMGLVGVVIFGASLGHLIGTPSLYGWSFDAAIVTQGGSLEDLQASGLTEDRATEAATYATLDYVQINGGLTEVLALSDADPGLHPTVRAGRAPLSRDEIVLGADVLDRAGVGIGDTVTVAGLEGEADLQVVGSAAYPEIGSNSTLGSMGSLLRSTATEVGAVEQGQAALVRLGPGHDASELSAYVPDAEVVTPFAPASIRNLEEVRRFPWIVGAFFAVLALAAIGHGVLRSVSARRHEWAVLTSLGIGRRDRRRMLAGQGAVVALVGVTVGTALGVVVGRWAWDLVAARSGVAMEVSAPPAALLCIGAAAVVTCLVAALVAPHAVRLRTANDLRQPD